MFERFCLLLLPTLLLAVACEHEDWEESPQGTGWTEDVGVKCGLDCFEQWCESGDMIECRSGICVGRPDSVYCTVPCDLDGECPENYLCTEECTDEVADESVCVIEEDFALLQDLGICPGA